MSINRNVLIIGRGYIGSYLDTFFNKSLTVTVTTVDHSKFANVNTRYQNLDVDFLKRYDVILWFAGHSSVPQASEDPYGAIENNILGLFSLANKLSRDQIVIYASSASIYSSLVAPQTPSVEDDAKLTPLNIYDSTKIAFDALSTFMKPKFIGLRLGTVSGYSEVFRQELIINSMISSAKCEGVVSIANKEAHRSILYLKDLARFIEKIIMVEDASKLPDFINLATHSDTIGNLGLQVAKFYGADIKYLPDSKTYSFTLDCALAKSLGFVQSNFDDVIEQIGDDID
jgi:UDP-glucose 4-epimerase